jgi:hypothetical protein
MMKMVYFTLCTLATSSLNSQSVNSDPSFFLVLVATTKALLLSYFQVAPSTRLVRYKKDSLYTCPGVSLCIQL